MTFQRLYGCKQLVVLFLSFIVLAFPQLSPASERRELKCASLDNYIDVVFQKHVLYADSTTKSLFGSIFQRVTQKIDLGEESGSVFDSNPDKKEIIAMLLERIPQLVLIDLRAKEIFLTSEEEEKFTQLIKNFNEKILRGDNDCSDWEELNQLLAVILKEAWESVLEISQNTQQVNLSLPYYAPAKLSVLPLSSKEDVSDILASKLNQFLMNSENPLSQSIKEFSQKYERRYREQEKIANNEADQLYNFLEYVAHAHDPHTDFMTPTEFNNFYSHLSGKTIGIGALLSAKGKYPTIYKILGDENSPLEEGDTVLAIDAENNSNLVSTEWLSANDLLKLIYGPEGSSLTLKIKRKNLDNPESTSLITLSRRQSDLVSSGVYENKVSYQIEDWPHSGKSQKIAVIHFPCFYEDFNDQEGASVSRDLENVLNKLSEQNIDAMLIDLRGNGGGSLNEAVRMVRFFIAQGDVVASLRNGVTTLYPSQAPHIVNLKNDVLYSGPLSILIDSNSASASEIFAGALQDYGRASIIGQSSSYGKATVQELFNERETGSIGASKATVAYFYTPSGKSNQFLGNVPDVKLPRLDISSVIPSHREKDFPFTLDPPALDAFADYSLAQGQGNQQWVSLLDQQINGLLQIQSIERLRHSEYFQSLEEQQEKVESLISKGNLEDLKEFTQWIKEINEKYSLVNQGLLKKEKDQAWSFSVDSPINAEYLNITADLSAIIQSRQLDKKIAAQ